MTKLNIDFENSFLKSDISYSFIILILAEQTSDEFYENSNHIALSFDGRFLEASSRQISIFMVTDSKLLNMLSIITSVHPLVRPFDDRRIW